MEEEKVALEAEIQRTETELNQLTEDIEKARQTSRINLAIEGRSSTPPTFPNLPMYLGVFWKTSLYLAQMKLPHVFV